MSVGDDGNDGAIQLPRPPLPVGLAEGIILFMTEMNGHSDSVLSELLKSLYHLHSRLVNGIENFGNPAEKILQNYLTFPQWGMGLY
jgi:hypothetical protein